MRRFELTLPRSVDSCVKFLARRGAEAKLVAGGTDLLPQLKNGLLRPAFVIDLSGVPPLRRLKADRQGLRVGAAVTAREIELNAAVRSRYPALAESGALVGSVQIRNLATVGGNLCNAAPSADMAPPLLALERRGGDRGAAGASPRPAGVLFPRRPAHRARSRRIAGRAGRARSRERAAAGTISATRPRRELDIAVVGVASQLTLSDGVCAKARIALAAVAPTPVRATAAEQALEGQPVTPEQIERAAELAVGAAQPISDQRGSADFRRHLVRVLTRRTLTTALARAGH